MANISKTGIIDKIRDSIRSTSVYEKTVASIGALVDGYLVKTALNTDFQDQQLPIYDYVDSLYNGLDKVVDSLTNGAVPDVVSAPIYAGVGTYLVLNNLQWLSKNVVDHIIPGFDEKYLPKLEIGCMAALGVAGTTFLILNPDIWKENQVYAAGMFSAGLTAMITAGKNVYEKLFQTNPTAN